MAESDKLNIDSIIARLLEGICVYGLSIFANFANQNEMKFVIFFIYCCI
jgi:hypothetical protein